MSAIVERFSGAEILRFFLHGFSAVYPVVFFPTLLSAVGVEGVVVVALILGPVLYAIPIEQAWGVEEVETIDTPGLLGRLRRLRQFVRKLVAWPNLNRDVYTKRMVKQVSSIVGGPQEEASQIYTMFYHEFLSDKLKHRVE